MENATEWSPDFASCPVTSATCFVPPKASRLEQSMGSTCCKGQICSNLLRPVLIKQFLKFMDGMGPSHVIFLFNINRKPSQNIIIAVIHFNIIINSLSLDNINIWSYFIYLIKSNSSLPSAHSLPDVSSEVSASTPGTSDDWCSRTAPGFLALSIPMFSWT